MIKYYLNNTTIWLLLVIGLLVVGVVHGDTNIIYDTTHKSIQVTSDVCTTLRVECNHDWYVDGYFYGSFPDNAMVPVTDDTNVSVNLYDPVNTNLDEMAESQTSWIIIVMTFMQPVLPWIFVVLFVYMVWRMMKKKRRR